MIMNYILFSIIVILIVYIGYQSHLIQKAQSKAKDDVQWTISFYTKCGEAKEEGWREERQQLLDRIQAPTFSEYKHQEAKIIKAKNGTYKPDIVIEQL